MDAAQSGFGSNPFAALGGGSNNSGSTENTQQGRVNTEPLPNPWAPAGGNSTSATTGSTTTTTNSSSGTTSTGMPSGMFNNPGMQSLMGQLQQNPQLMQNMLQAPYMQSMLQAMQTNPDMMQSVISTNPIFAGNPEMQEYMRTMMPTMLQQVSLII